GKFARINIYSYGRVSIEIVAWSRLRIVLRNRVARTPYSQPCRRIVRARLPDAATPSFPSVVFILPCFAPGVAGFWYDVPPPKLIAGSRVQRRNPSPCSGISCAVCNDDFALGRDRRRHEFFLVAELVGGS